MAISDVVIEQVRTIVAQPGFHDEPRHQIGKTAFFVASSPKHAEGYQQKGKVTVDSGEYLIVVIPQTI